MSLVTLELPASTLERLLVTLERLATSAERLADHFAPYDKQPTYTPHRSHTSVADYATIRKVEELNESRRRDGLPELSYEESVATLTNVLP